MNPREFYNEKPQTIRSLRDGKGVRNVHNFIKSVLILENIPSRCVIVDLGCGQGGDFCKLQRKNPQSYIGLDVSSTALDYASKRSTLRCPKQFRCLDFTKNEWEFPCRVVNCQFAIQYAFRDETCAHFCISNIAKNMEQGGIFLGTLPMHTSPTYTKVVVTIPGDESRTCSEYSVLKHDMINICKLYGLECVEWCEFQKYYETKKQEYNHLATIMHATDGTPNEDNIVFVFEKKGVYSISC